MSIDINELAKQARELWTRRGKDDIEMHEKDADTLAWSVVEDVEAYISLERRPYVRDQVSKILYKNYLKETNYSPQFISNLFQSLKV